MKLNEIIEDVRPSETTRSEIARLHSAGFQLIPLGGEDGKRPAIAGWKGKRLTLSQVFGPMYARSSGTYGICLPGIVVLDCDQNDPALVDHLEERFGAATVKIQTARGVHLYYERGDALPALRSDGLPVDVKSGGASYVLGPYAQRPDGTIYTPLEGCLGETRLNRLRGEASLAVARSGPTNVAEGSRHGYLLRKGIGMVAHVDTLPELEANLAWERDENCLLPGGVSDAELAGIARWCWEKRLINALYAGRNSDVKVPRSALDLLREHNNASDARALYTDLCDQHGHSPGKLFALNYQAMRKAGWTDLSRDRFRAARRTLENAGLLRKARPHAPGRHGARYQLTMPYQVQGKATERSLLTFDNGNPSQPSATLEAKNVRR